MAIESALLGGILGGVARLAPEVLKFFDRKGERKHELALGDQQAKLIELQGKTRLDELHVTTEAAQMVAGVEALKEAYASQKTGFKFADTVNAIMRPWITAMVVGFWAAVKVAAFVQLAQGDIAWTVALQASWTDNDWTMLAGVTNFWFLSRVFEKK